MLKNYSTKQLALFIIIVTAIIGGGGAVFTKVAVKEIPALSYTFLRFVIASVSILPFFLRDKPKLHKDIYKVILFSLFMTYNVAVFPFGVALTTATISQVLYAAVPIIVAVLSYYFFAEKFTGWKTVGIVIGFLGAFIVIMLPILTKNAPFSGNILGNLIIFSAAVAVALYTLLSRPFQRHYTPLQVTSIFIFTTTSILFFLALTDLWTHPHWWDHVTIPSLGSTLYVGLLGTTVWYLLYQYAIKHSSPVTAAMTLYLQPATAFVWAAFFLGEQLTIGLVIGVAITFLGLYLTLKTKKSSKSS
jgi:drug/metabolite transporter (DMT)-like permease